VSGCGWVVGVGERGERAGGGQRMWWWVVAWGGVWCGGLWRGLKGFVGGCLGGSWLVLFWWVFGYNRGGAGSFVGVCVWFGLSLCGGGGGGGCVFGGGLEDVVVFGLDEWNLCGGCVGCVGGGWFFFFGFLCGFGLGCVWLCFWGVGVGWGRGGGTLGGGVFCGLSFVFGGVSGRGCTMLMFRGREEGICFSIGGFCGGGGGGGVGCYFVLGVFVVVWVVRVSLFRLVLLCGGAGGFGLGGEGCVGFGERETCV